MFFRMERWAFSTLTATVSRCPHHSLNPTRAVGFSADLTLDISLHIFAAVMVLPGVARDEMPGIPQVPVGWVDR